MDDENNFKKKIRETLSEHPEGLSNAEISRLLNIHRHTAARYIQFLMGAGIVYQRDLGPIKLHYLASKFPEEKRQLLERLQKRGAKG